MFTTLKKWFASPAARRSPHCRLNLEGLADRLVPAVVSLTNGVLSISGSDGTDLVHVTEDHQANRIFVEHNTASGWRVEEFSTAGLTEVRAVLGEGADTFDYRQRVRNDGSQGPFTDSKKFTVDLGNVKSGTDFARIDFSSNMASYDLFNANVAIDVRGDLGNQSVKIVVPQSYNSNVNFYANLGRQNDDFGLDITGSLRFDSDVTGAAYGGDGMDSLALTANSVSDLLIDSASSVGVTLHGGWNSTKAAEDRDSIATNFYGELDGTFGVTAIGGQQRDTIESRFTLTGSSTGFLNVQEWGDAGDDLLILTVQGVALPPGHLDAVVHADNDDTVGVTDNVQVV